MRRCGALSDGVVLNRGGVDTVALTLRSAHADLNVGGTSPVGLAAGVTLGP